MREDVGSLSCRALRVTDIHSAFHALLPSDFMYDGEAHNSWEFVYVDEGRVKAKAGNHDYVLKKGELVCHKPGEFHAIQPYHGSAEVIIFSFSCTASEMEFFNQKILFASAQQKQFLHDIATLAASVFLPKSPHQIGVDGRMDRNLQTSPILVQMLFRTMELLILSLLSAEGTQRDKRVESYTQHLQRKRLTADIRSYVEENLQRKIVLDEISRHVSYSTSSIKRIFKEETGVSVMHYVTDCRIRRSKKLLEGKLSVSEVAEAVGFDTVNYFSTVFRNKTGVSPSEYREGKTARKEE